MGGLVASVKHGDIIVEYPQDTVRPMIVLKSPFFDGTGTNPIMLEDKPNDVGAESKDECNEVEKVCKSGLIELKDHPKPTFELGLNWDSNVGNWVKNHPNWVKLGLKIEPVAG